MTWPKPAASPCTARSNRPLTLALLYLTFLHKSSVYNKIMSSWET